MQLYGITTRWWIVANAVALGGLAGYALLLSALLLLPARIEEWRHRQDFDARVWRSQVPSEHGPQWPPRLCMVDGLLASGRLNGTTSDQLVELLGPPTVRATAAGVTKPEISYYLGSERGNFGIDSETLCIRFGPDGKVERAWIHHD